MVQERGGRIPEAQLAYRGAVDADPRHARAQTNLAQLYVRGIGTDQDLPEALWWLEQAAEQSEPAAQILLATMYDEGRGVARDPQRAEHWRRRAEESGMGGWPVSLPDELQPVPASSDSQ